MKRDQTIWAMLRSAAAVVVITGLIWLTADQNVSVSEIVQFPVRIVSENRGRHAGFAAPPYELMFKAEIAGRRRHVSEFREKISSKHAAEAVVDDRRQTSPRPQSIPSREVLGWIRSPEKARIDIRSVEPQSVSLFIDEYETVADVRVVCDFGDLKVVAEPTPARVSVRLPRFAAERLRADPVARASAEQRIRSARRPDGGFQIKAPLVFDAIKNLDPGMTVEILPAPEVTISGQIESMTRTLRKGPIQITWSIPDQVQRDFKIVADPTSNMRPDIDVTGPSDLIEQLDVREIRAFVDIMASDTEKPMTVIKRPVTFILPPGFSLSEGSPPHDISFQLVSSPSPVPASP